MGAIEKRKTYTSSQVKERYNSKVYGRIFVRLPKELVEEFKEECVKRDVSQASVIKEAIREFLGK